MKIGRKEERQEMVVCSRTEREREGEGARMRREEGMEEGDRNLTRGKRMMERGEHVWKKIGREVMRIGRKEGRGKGK